MFRVYHSVEDIWEAQLRDIEQAKHTILVEQYIMEDFDEGGIGRRFLDALVRKAREGVEVRCILDAQGCFEFFKSDELNDLLTDAGGKVFYYKTLGVSQLLISPVRLFLRDHRKLILIDREISWIGGAVVGERFRTWQDLMVRFTSEDIADVLNKEFRTQLLRLEDKTDLLAPMQTIDEKYHITGNAPGLGNRFCYEEICHGIMRATESVILVTPYFAPPWKLERVIRRRLAEGLRIELLVTRTTDHWLADASREGYLKKMLKSGLILRYADEMIHAKAVIVDGRWMTFGSTNLDALSLIFNHELNLTTTDTDLITEVTRCVQAWSAGLELITEATCEYRKLSFVTRLLGRCLRYAA